MSPGIWRLLRGGIRPVVFRGRDRAPSLHCPHHRLEAYGCFPGISSPISLCNSFLASSQLIADWPISQFRIRPHPVSATVTIHSLVAAAAGGILLSVCQPHEVFVTCEPAANQSPSVQVNPEDLTKDDHGEVASNSHTARWRIFTDNGREMFAKGRMEEAERYLKQAILEAEKGFGPQDAHVASSYNNLAELYRVRREYTKAEPLYLEAVERMKAALGPESYSVSVALHHLGGFYLLQRKLESARNCYEESLKLKSKTVGPAHPEYAKTMFHLGEVIRLQGHLPDAIALIRDSINILEECGDSHAAVFTQRLGRLAELLVSVAELAEAEKIQRKLLHATEMDKPGRNTSIKREDGGSSRPYGQLGCSLFKRAALLMIQGDGMVKEGKERGAVDEYERAGDMLREANRIAEKQFSLVLKTLPLAARKQGEGDEESQKRPLPLAAQLLPLVQSLSALGVVRVRMSKMTCINVERRGEHREEAERALRRCRQILVEYPPTATWQSASTLVIQKEHVACLQTLAQLLSHKRKELRIGTMDSRMKEIEGEIKALLEEAHEIESSIARS